VAGYNQSTYGFEHRQILQELADKLEEIEDGKNNDKANPK
jgi:hypothetical protein